MDKKRILLFGATGMAGHMAYYYLRGTGKYDVQDVVFRTPLTENSIVVDATNAGAVAELVRRERPDVILNCVGVLVRGSKEHPENAVYLNAYFPRQLAALAAETGAKLVHISTDCVFSGKKGMYGEDDFRDADDVYGRSKALGEVTEGKNLTLRTSIIGPELKRNGEGLFHWFMQQSGTVQGYQTAIWGGVTTLELAKAIDAALTEGWCGLVQISNGQGISKLDLLRLFQSIWKKDDVKIVPVDANGVDKSIRKSERVGFPVPAYGEMLEEMKRWMDAHRKLYSANYTY